MTHQNDYPFANDPAEKGLEVVPELLSVLINDVMHKEIDDEQGYDIEFS